MHLSLSLNTNNHNDTAMQDATKEMESQATPAEEPAPVPPPAKFHHYTVCLVPPETEAAWQALTQARTQLRDPGLFRWPPHANLLYPFVDPKVKQQQPGKEEDNDEHSVITKAASLIDPEILQGLQGACRQVEPFTIRLERLGTFGGNKRGVLWMDPMSCRQDDEKESSSNDKEGPLLELQARLQEAFPYCNEQQKISGRFVPHMTLSHFENLDVALEAQEKIESWWDTSQTFGVSEIYLLYRRGDAGQFERLVTLGLGAQGTVTVHDPPLPFASMPREEAEWVRQERMKLKARRNRKGGRGAQRRRPRARRSRSPPDTPEIIAQKRAERKAKREALEREAAEKERLALDDQNETAI